MEVNFKSNSAIKYQQADKRSTPHIVTNSPHIDKMPIDKIPSGIIRANLVAFKGISELNKNAELGQKAYDYVKSLNLYSTTRNNQDLYTNHEEYNDAVSKIRHINRARAGMPYDEFIEMTKNKVNALKVGNCTENAIMVASYLKEQEKYNNIALIAAFGDVYNSEEFYKDPNGNSSDYNDHVFAVMGLDEKADLRQPETWGENAIVIDPWNDCLTPVIKDNKLNPVFVSKMKESVDASESVLFENYAKVHSENVAGNSPYNWESHRGKELL